MIRTAGKEVGRIRIKVVDGCVVMTHTHSCFCQEQEMKEEIYANANAISFCTHNCCQNVLPRTINHTLGLL